MNIFTTTIVHTAATYDSEDRISGMSFKKFDSAVEYLIDWLYDEGFILENEVPDVERELRETGAFSVSHLEVHIVENELCAW